MSFPFSFSRIAPPNAGLPFYAPVIDWSADAAVGAVWTVGQEPAAGNIVTFEFDKVNTFDGGSYFYDDHVLSAGEIIAETANIGSQPFSSSGTWYVRCRVGDGINTPSAWSNIDSRSITVNAVVDDDWAVWISAAA